jgi:hypothetical protein
MRLCLFLLALCCLSIGVAQAQKAISLPEAVVIPTSSDDYTWERMLQVKGRTIFNNTIAATDSLVYSMGGFNTLRVQKEINRIEGTQLLKDTLTYPGAGSMNNIFFIQDSFMYIGGGHDSGRSYYSSRDFWAWNSNAHTWKRLKDLPFYYLHSLHSFSWKGKTIVLIGRLEGKDLKDATPVAYEYDAEQDEWIIRSKYLPPSILTKGEAAPFNNSQFLRSAAFIIGSDIFILFQNTCGIAGRCTNTFYKLSLSSGNWTELQPFPADSKFLSSSFAVSDDIFGYVGGGFSSITGQNLKQVYRYDPERSKWERIKDLPRGVRYAKGWRYKNQSYIGFGINDKDLTVVVWRLSKQH